MDAQRLQGPKGRFRNGSVVAISNFERGASVFTKRPCWKWVARNSGGAVIAVYEVEHWTDGGSDGALWQLRELAASYFHPARVYRGY